MLMMSNRAGYSETDLNTLTLRVVSVVLVRITGINGCRTAAVDRVGVASGEVGALVVLCPDWSKVVCNSRHNVMGADRELKFGGSYG